MIFIAYAWYRPKVIYEVQLGLYNIPVDSKVYLVIHI